MIFRVKQENKYSTFKVKAWATQGSVLWPVFYLVHTTNAFGTQPYFAICKSIEELTRENPTGNNTNLRVDKNYLTPTEMPNKFKNK